MESKIYGSISHSPSERGGEGKVAIGRRWSECSKVQHDNVKDVVNDDEPG